MQNFTPGRLTICLRRPFLAAFRTGGKLAGKLDRQEESQDRRIDTQDVDDER